MDTPGHVDFAYEVSRSLAACEGALLVVDAAQGVEAQTLANVYQSIEHDHEIVPVINKIDLPAADPEGVRQEIEEIIGLDASERGPRLSARPASASSEVLEAIVDKIPPPTGDAARSAQGDARRQLVRPLPRRGHPRPRHRRRDPQGPAGQVHGRRHHPPGRPRRLLPPQDRAAAASSAPARSASSPRRSRKSPRPASATPSPTPSGPPRQALPGFKLVQPVVFCGLFPVDAADFEKLRDSPLQAAPQRRLVQLRDGDQRRARLRLPLRLPRPPPPRDHPGAADPRIRPRPHHHRAQRRLRGPPSTRRRR